MALAVGSASNEADTVYQGRGHLERLESLAAELGERGLSTRLIAPTGAMPSLRVVNPVVWQMAEDVYVSRSQDGLWWFWWPWAERIGPGDQLAVAAALIARVLCANPAVP